MKILINYDMIDYVKNVNTPLGPLKVVRDNKKRWVKFNLPLYAAFDYLVLKDIKTTIAFLPIQFASVAVAQAMLHKYMGVDAIANKSEYYLKQLITKLKDINIETDYDLIKKSSLDGRKYNIRINENKLPELVESKYILVPSYNYNGQVKESSLLQEHVVGSNNYVLSSESKQKVLKPAFANG